MTRNQIQDMIDRYVKAEQAVLSGKSYTINNRSLTRADLSDIREGRQGWERRLQALKSGGRGHSLASFD